MTSRVKMRKRVSPGERSLRTADVNRSVVEWTRNQRRSQVGLLCLVPPMSLTEKRLSRIFDEP